jgi:hypothetical protein
MRRSTKVLRRVSGYGGVGDCEDLANDAEGRAAAEEWAFPQMCEGSRGKAYADEWRCTNGTVEIKCQ